MRSRIVIGKGQIMKVSFYDGKMELKAGRLYGVFADADEKKLIADYPDEIKDLYEGVRSQYDPKPQKAFFTASQAFVTGRRAICFSSAPLIFFIGRSWGGCSRPRKMA